MRDIYAMTIFDHRWCLQRVQRRSLVSASGCAAQLLMKARTNWAVARQDRATWRSFKSRVVSRDRRVVYPALPDIIHPERQSSALLLAEYHDDRGALCCILAWTRQRLSVRMDRLLVWRYRPGPGAGRAMIFKAPPSRFRPISGRAAVGPAVI